MNQNLKNTTGLGVCAFCGSGDHVFTKETCPQYKEQKRNEKSSFLSAIDQMGYSEIEFLEVLQKGKTPSIVSILEKDNSLFRVDEVTAVKNYIKLHTNE